MNTINSFLKKIVNEIKLIIRFLRIKNRLKKRKLTLTKITVIIIFFMLPKIVALVFNFLISHLLN